MKQNIKKENITKNLSLSDLESMGLTQLKFKCSEEFDIPIFVYFNAKKYVSNFAKLVHITKKYPIPKKLEEDYDSALLVGFVDQFFDAIQLYALEVMKEKHTSERKKNPIIKRT